MRRWSYTTRRYNLKMAPNSPDLSPIELIWSIVKGMLNIFEPKDVNELKVAIKSIWYSIPVEICQRIIDHTEKRWDLCIKHRGRRLDKELLRKIEPNHDSIKGRLGIPLLMRYESVIMTNLFLN